MKKMTSSLRRLVSLTLSLTLAAALIPAQAAKTYDQIPNGTYIVSSRASEKMKLDMYGNYTGKATNAQVYQTTPGNLTQQFRFTYNKEKNWYGINPMSNTKMALNAYSESPKSGTNVNVWPKLPKNSTQNWVLEQVEGGYYVIRLAYNKNLALTATGTKNQSNVKLSKYTGSKAQQWKLTPIKTPGKSATVISEGTMKALIKKVGVQKGNSAYTNRCAGVDVAYLYYWLHGKTTSVDASALWTKVGGTCVWASSKENLYSRMKTHLANGGPCILHVKSSAGQHWVVVRAYKDNIFYIADPWNGKLTTLDKSGYTLHGDLRVILCQGK